MDLQVQKVCDHSLSPDFTYEGFEIDGVTYVPILLMYWFTSWKIWAVISPTSDQWL